MTKDEIKTELIGILKQIMVDMNPEEPLPDITPTTRPLLDLPNFDSLTGIMATLSCGEKFKFDDEKIQSVFVKKDDNGKCRVLTVDEIADTLHELMENSKKSEAK